jgi:hypothetical protein
MHISGPCPALLIRDFHELPGRINQILEGAVVCFRKAIFEKFMTTASAAQRPCDLFAMSKELLYQVFIMTQCPNAATIVSMGVADIKASTSLPIFLINHQQHNWQDQKVYTRYLWLFWLVFENCRQEDDERLRCWSTSAMKNKDISLKRYNLYSSKGRSSSNGISKKL